MKRNRLSRLSRLRLFLTLASVLACGSVSNVARAEVILGAASSFAVLGSSTVTNTGMTTLVGDIGVSPGTAITGFYGTNNNDGPGTFTGRSYQETINAYGVQARVDATTAYNYLDNLVVTQDLTGQDLGGLTLPPGVYSFSSSAQLTGNLILDGAGEYVFRMGSTLTTATDSSVSFINGANPFTSVFWNVGSSATLGTGTRFGGTIISVASNTLVTGASVDGRVIALNGAVTLDTNNIVSVGAASVPEPSTLLSFMAAVGLATGRRRRTV
jgi:hypothetical protein